MQLNIYIMAKSIIGRYTEKEKLKEALDSHRSELIAIYGRRRIGKTHLIREYYAKNIIFSFTGLRQGTRQAQISNFMLELQDASNLIFDKYPQDWLYAFNILRGYLKKIKESGKKKVIFIDEFPWVDTQRSGFLPAFENFWNTYCTTRNDLIVVICGSAASYMIKKIIRNRGGLHNRITRKIKLEPFNLSEVREFLQYKKIIIPEIEILKIYMTFGGIAEYIEHIKKGDSSVTAIERTCFQKGAQLEFEFEEVFKSLFDQGSYHEKIIDSLSKGPKMGLTRDEILKDLDVVSGGQITNSMDELIESGFVEKYQSIRSRRKTTLYRIFDEFCLFHLQFISKFKGSSWSQLYKKQEYLSWCGYAFEIICYKHIKNVKREMLIDQINSKNYGWSNNKAQVDLVIDRDDNIVNLCEIKFYNSEFNIDADYATKLRNKESQFKTETGTRKGVNTVMITTWGIKGKNSIGLVTHNLKMECLFKD
jgi:uncharacterized protein